MATISKAGISNASTIEAAHVTNIIDALDGTTSREIKIPGSMQVTGSLDTKGVNTHTNTNTFSGAVTVNDVFDLSSSASAFHRRLQVLNNSTSGNYALTDYVAGTTFEIDLGSNSTNDITINFGDCPIVSYNVEYDIRFCRAALGAGATLILANGGEFEVRGLNCNTNASFAITNTTGTATTSQTDLIYSHIKINNIQNINSDPFWQVRVWSNHSALLTIT
tara:strand:+ start:1686 stop:2348 length:663 start_codon:yes stop_codon:yes gene_type:complete